jgi:hypothetical protein
LIVIMYCALQHAEVMEMLDGFQSSAGFPVDFI